MTPPSLPSSVGRQAPVRGLQTGDYRAGYSWRAAQDAERDVFDGRRLPPAWSPKQLLHDSNDLLLVEPFTSKRCSKLEVQGMGELGRPEPPAVAPSVLHQLHPNRRAISFLLHFCAQ